MEGKKGPHEHSSVTIICYNWLSSLSPCHCKCVSFHTLLFKFPKDPVAILWLRANTFVYKIESCLSSSRPVLLLCCASVDDFLIGIESQEICFKVICFLEHFVCLIKAISFNALFAILKKIIYILLVPFFFSTFYYQWSNIWHLKCLALKIPDRIVITWLKQGHSFKKNWK